MLSIKGCIKEIKQKSTSIVLMKQWLRTIKYLKTRQSLPERQI